MSWSFLLRSYVHPCRLEFGWLEGAATLFLNNEPQPARLILRDLVNAAVGFEELAKETAKPSKSLHLVFSVSGSQSMRRETLPFAREGKILYCQTHGRCVPQADSH